jgi:hypothetical protein
MQVERDYLVKVVCLALRAELVWYRVNLVDVDLPPQPCHFPLPANRAGADFFLQTSLCSCNLSTVCTSESPTKARAREIIPQTSSEFSVNIVLNSSQVSGRASLNKERGASKRQ